MVLNTNCIPFWKPIKFIFIYGVRWGNIMSMKIVHIFTMLWNTYFRQFKQTKWFPVSLALLFVVCYKWCFCCSFLYRCSDFVRAFTNTTLIFFSFLYYSNFSFHFEIQKIMNYYRNRIVICICLTTQACIFFAVSYE